VLVLVLALVLVLVLVPVLVLVLVLVLMVLLVSPKQTRVRPAAQPRGVVRGGRRHIRPWRAH
jgi:hypothetical protein